MKVYHPSGFWLRDFQLIYLASIRVWWEFDPFLYLPYERKKKEQTVLVLLQPTWGRVEQAGHDGELAGKIELLQNDPYPGQGRGGSRGR